MEKLFEIIRDRNVELVFKVEKEWGFDMVSNLEKLESNILQQNYRRISWKIEKKSWSFLRKLDSKKDDNR